MNRWEKTRECVQEISRFVIAALDWFVKVAERLMVLGIMYVVFYFGYLFYRGSLSKGQKSAIEFAAQNWKIVFILLIPLFYLTVRTFLEEVQVAAGMTRAKKALEPSPSSALPPPNLPNPVPDSLPVEE